jgi:hypothetical protein
MKPFQKRVLLTKPSSLIKQYVRRRWDLSYIRFLDVRRDVNSVRLWFHNLQANTNQFGARLRRCILCHNGVAEVGVIIGSDCFPGICK